MRTAALAPIFAALAALTACAAPLGFSSTYSPSSSHILIGDAEQRRIVTLGLEYTHLVASSPHFRLDYVGSVLPLYEETDPFVQGTYFSLAGQSIVTQQPPTRVTYAIRGPVGAIAAGNGTTVPVFALTGRQNTYAAAFTPLGARIDALPRRRIQPTFAIDLGFVVSARDIPIDNSSSFNYLFSFGSGFELFTDAHTSWRLEYLYRHTSNAGQGAQNPGVDQGVVRVTLSHHR